MRIPQQLAGKFSGLAICLWIGMALTAPAAAQVERLSDDVTPTRYRLDLHVDPRTDGFSGTALISVRLSNPTKIIRLHGRDLTVSDALATDADGKIFRADYKEDGETGHATLELMQAIGPGDVTLQFEYERAFNTSYEGLYKVERNGVSYAYTHFQPLRARQMFPGFDEPKFKTPYEITITVSEQDQAVSNGPVNSVMSLGDGKKRISFSATEPIPTYLVALAVGEFDIVEWDALPPNAVRPHPVPLRGITAKGKGDKIRYALKHTAAMMNILEDYFASPYPYAKLDLIAAAGFNPGGMENVGAIIYREDRILLGDNPSIYQERGFAGIHAHELAHMWFGNSVTPAWWDDLWLNEAFATWMSSKVRHAWRPDVYSDRGPIRSANWAKWADRRTTARQIRNPIRNEGDISLAFDSITYSKGGGVLAMIERYVGPDTFRDGLRLYVSRHAHGVATADDFFNAIAESADAPGMKAAFQSFIGQPGTPLVNVDWTCDPSGGATVSLTQSRSLPVGSTGRRERTWTIPLCLAWDGVPGRKSQCTLFDQPDMTFRLASASCPAAILPNRDGSAYINFRLPQRGWDALIPTIPDLPPGEALALLRSLEMAYVSGTVDTQTIFSASMAAARSPYWDVVQAPMQSLRRLKLFLIPRSERHAILDLLQEFYRPQLANIDTSDAALKATPSDIDSALSRSNLIWFLAVDAEEPKLGRILARHAQSLLGHEGDQVYRPEALHPNLHRVALYAGLRNIGPSFAETMIRHLKTTRDSSLRGHIVIALAHSTDPAIVERVWSLILDEDISRYDAGQLLRRQGEKVDNAHALFDWMIANYGAILDRIPRSHHRWIPWRTSAFCDPADRARVKDFFSGPGKTRASEKKVLQGVLEEIDLCIAFVEAQGQGALDEMARFQR